MSTSTPMPSGSSSAHSLHPPLELAHQVRIPLELLENQGEDLQRLPADVVLHAFHVAKDRGFVESEALQEAGKHIVALGDGLPHAAPIVGERHAAIAFV